MNDSLYIGIDGCKGGWVAAILDHGQLLLKPYNTITELFTAYPHPDACLIDMAIGLQQRPEDIRPDSAARKELGKKGSSVFPVPCRQAVQVKTEGREPQAVQQEQKCINEQFLGCSLSQQSLAIIPKIKEIDDFLEGHNEYKDVFVESHPELCYARLNGEVLFSKKARVKGREERIKVLRSIDAVDSKFDVSVEAKECCCKPDDILDAIVLAVTARMKAQGLCEIISGNSKNPSNPPKDAKGLPMQMVVPVNKTIRERLEKHLVGNRKEKRVGTGFSAPTIGTVYPKGTTFVRNEDGTITIVPPKTEVKGEEESS